MTAPIHRHIEYCDRCMHEHACREIEGLMLCGDCREGVPCRLLVIDHKPTTTSS